MKMLSIKLKGYGRFGLGNIELIEMDFKSIHQIIIGTNGCGKSSLLSEMSPLPPASSDFPMGGYKEVVAEVEGKIYRLRSDFTKAKAVHAMTIDGGENLNNSRTESEQRQLVRSHFNLTPQLLDLFLRKLSFTKMTSNQRRDWLMAISGMDFTYAMKLNTKSREAHKEAIGAAKDLAGREIEETRKMEGLRGEGSVRLEIDVLHREITRVMGLKSNVDITQYSQAYLYQILSRMRTESELILGQRAVLPDEFSRATTIEDLIRLQGDAEASIRLITDDLTELYLKKEKTEALAVKMSNNISDIDSFTSETDDIRYLANNILLESNRYFCPVDEAMDLSFIQIVEENLSYLFSRYPDNSDKRFSATNRAQYIDEQKGLSRIITDLKEGIDADRNHMKHLKGISSVDCPRCQYEFTPGVDPLDLEGTEKRICANLDTLVKHEARFNEVCEYLVDFGNLVQLRGEILRAIGEYTLTATLKTAYLNAEQHGATPRMLLGELGDWMVGMSDSRLYMESLRQISDNELALQHAVDLETVDKSHRAEMVSDIDLQIDRLLTKRCSVEVTLESLKNFIRKATRIRESGLVLEKLSKVFDDSWDKHTSALSDLEVNKYLGLRQSELAILEKELSDLNSIGRIVESLGKYRLDAERNVKAAKRLLEVLSPNTGLIAEHITSFMNALVSKMNEIIASVWAYPMEIIAPSLDGGDLDYKFPISIANAAPESDIVKTSSAQADMINIAFVMAVMEFLEPAKFPLYLDEFGIDMDETHRFNSLAFIKSFVEGSGCSQMFLISHYVATHGVFTTAEICLLDISNIVNKPAVYNKHVRIYTK